LKSKSFFGICGNGKNYMPLSQKEKEEYLASFSVSPTWAQTLGAIVRSIHSDLSALSALEAESEIQIYSNVGKLQKKGNRSLNPFIG
jgi:hypothetical protein